MDGQTSGLRKCLSHIQNTNTQTIV